jgi:hypothetical protein
MILVQLIVSPQCFPANCSVLSMRSNRIFFASGTAIKESSTILLLDRDAPLRRQLVSVPPVAKNPAPLRGSTLGEVREVDDEAGDGDGMSANVGIRYSGGIATYSGYNSQGSVASKAYSYAAPPRRREAALTIRTKHERDEAAKAAQISTASPSSSADAPSCEPPLAASNLSDDDLSDMPPLTKADDSESDALLHSIAPPARLSAEVEDSPVTPVGSHRLPCSSVSKVFSAVNPAFSSATSIAAFAAARRGSGAILTDAHDKGRLSVPDVNSCADAEGVDPAVVAGAVSDMALFGDHDGPGAHTQAGT